MKKNKRVGTHPSRVKKEERKKSRRACAKGRERESVRDGGKGKEKIPN